MNHIKLNEVLYRSGVTLKLLCANEHWSVSDCSICLNPIKPPLSDYLQTPILMNLSRHGF